ncbi:integrase catalytic domain-containing protein [Caerostris extrusa]|uniref:Integrase catalytic domain-containing protein n=1 Tax=Caerostris extrusa TaxID=172846 RepID=A0AAV4PR81_CAEEX|nr:integrase catalytic domain-containing protein [Caerostris extrusa]
MKKKIIVDLRVKIERPEWFERFSSFSKIVRVFCWMIHFENKLRKRLFYGTNTLTDEEKTKAEIILWSIEQKKHFHEKENSVHGLQVKAKATCQELKVGDIVLIELGNKKRVMWPMGKIEKIYSSRDGASRVVQVKTSSDCLTRPIQKLYLLEVSTSGDPVLTLTTENRSRYGRLFKSSKK